jgi:hypothetical protein
MNQISHGRIPLGRNQPETKNVCLKKMEKIKKPEDSMTCLPPSNSIWSYHSLLLLSLYLLATIGHPVCSVHVTLCTDKQTTIQNGTVLPK